MYTSQILCVMGKSATLHVHLCCMSCCVSPDFLTSPAYLVRATGESACGFQRQPRGSFGQHLQPYSSRELLMPTVQHDQLQIRKTVIDSETNGQLQRTC
jgi:hypothetical protein